MRHRTGLPAQRIRRGGHQTVTVDHPIATNSHFYGVAATTTFRRDELSFPPGLGDRTHRRTRLATTMRSSAPPPTRPATTGRRPSPPRRFTGAADELIGLFARFTAPTRTPCRHHRRIHCQHPVVHRQQRSAQCHNRRADRSHSRLRVGSHPEVTTTTERHVATSRAPTVSLGATTVPDAEPTGRMRDSLWVAMHQAPPSTAR
jgi:hypothetical protein